MPPFTGGGTHIIVIPSTLACQLSNACNVKDTDFILLLKGWFEDGGTFYFKVCYTRRIRVIRTVYTINVTRGNVLSLVTDNL